MPYNYDEEIQEQAERFNSDKLKWSLVDFRALEPMVQVLEFGAQKYSANNWKKGMPITKIIESLLRHTFAVLDGEDFDMESELPHVGHILCNAMFLSHMVIQTKGKWDDRNEIKEIEPDRHFGLPPQKLSDETERIYKKMFSKLEG